MSLYRRKDSPHWWIKLSHNGRTIQRSAGTSDRIKAREYHDKLKAQLWDVVRLGVKPHRTWEEAVIRFLDEKAHKASLRDDRRNFRWLHSHLAGKNLTEIDRECIDRVREARRKERVSSGTVNRTLALLRSVLRTAVNDWEWIDRAPKVRLLREESGRVRFLTKEEAARLLSELPEHLAPVVGFSILTGLRQRNVRELRWSQVDLERRAVWIHPHEAKGRKGISVPLTVEAAQIVATQRGKHEEFVFSFRGKCLRSVNNTAWRNALKRAGIEGFRWHDLRHTWATWHAQAGTLLHVLQELGGWASATMVKRYAHFTSEHLASYVDDFGKVVRLVPKAGDNSATQAEVST